MIPGTLFLALRHARHNPARSLLVTACVTVAFLVPILTHLISSEFERTLTARARATPIVVGSAGSRFDLVLSALYFRRATIRSISMADWQSLSDTDTGVMIPMNTRFTARALPIVAASADYASFRGLRCSSGTLPTIIGECALGARAARELGLRAGDTIFSDQIELFDLSKPPALKLHITGVLAPQNTPDDQSLFTDIKTAWVLEGLSHSHADAKTAVPDEFVLERSDSSVMVSEALVDDNEVTQANAAAFHLHATPDQLPLSCVIVIPRSDKDATILRARINARKEMQAVVPSAVIDELLGYVVRVRAVLNAIAIVIAAMAATLITLVTALSVKVRAREVATLVRLGASSRTIVMLFGWEIVCILGAAVLLALGLAQAAWALLPDPVKLL